MICTENQGFPYMSEVKETAATHNMAKPLLRALGRINFHRHHLLLGPFDIQSKRHAGDLRNALLVLVGEVHQSGTPGNLDLPTVVLA